MKLIDLKGVICDYVSLIGKLTVNVLIKTMMNMT